MASIEVEKYSPEWLMFKDYWILCKKFWIPEDNVEYWDSVIRELSDFYKKYSDEIFAKGLALAFIETLDKKMRQRDSGGQESGTKGEYPFRICGYARKYPFLGEAVLNLIEEIGGKMGEG